jgi:hypothetical protein
MISTKNHYVKLLDKDLIEIKMTKQIFYLKNQKIVLKLLMTDFINLMNMKNKKDLKVKIYLGILIDIMVI